MSTPDIMLSPHCICVIMRAVRATHLSAYAVKVVLFRWLRRYRLVTAELSFCDSVCLKPTFNIQKLKLNLLNSGPKDSTTYQLVVMPIPALNYLQLTTYGLYGFGC